MHYTSNFLVSDLKDKVMAVFSLFGAAGAEFTPDYSWSTEKLYTEFAGHLVRPEEGAAMLSYAGLHRRNQITGIPSWVPDWSAQSLHHGPKIIEANRNPPFASAGQSKPSMSLVEHGLDLLEQVTVSAKGVIV